MVGLCANYGWVFKSCNKSISISHLRFVCYRNGRLVEMVGYFEHSDGYWSPTNLGKFNFPFWTASQRSIGKFWQIRTSSSHPESIKDAFACTYTSAQDRAEYWTDGVQTLSVQSMCLLLYEELMKLLDTFRWDWLMQYFILDRSKNCCTIQNTDVHCKLSDRTSLMLVYSDDSMHA